ncbi:uncharacterized protein LOC108903993 [Anoplophora glabripennis]|uniref:uncharacterized protein LOC108903993 n=1 Tax=Anoplophora glabripennis TaxID=217634 RepID=UPI000874ACD5|nr:uncharacterized protein LOC108903993 [Anoplophora glabripennis]
MISWQHSFGLLLLATLWIKDSYAISCYDCNSVIDRRCLGDQNNILTEDLKKPCPKRQDGKEFTLCRKIKQVIDFEVNGLQPDSRVIRACGYEDKQYANRCYQRSGFGGRQEVCACQEDGCNATSTTIASISLVLGLLFLLNINF